MRSSEVLGRHWALPETAHPQRAQVAIEGIRGGPKDSPREGPIECSKEGPIERPRGPHSAQGEGRTERKGRTHIEDPKERPIEGTWSVAQSATRNQLLDGSFNNFSLIFGYFWPSGGPWKPHLGPWASLWNLWGSLVVRGPSLDSFGGALGRPRGSWGVLRRAPGRPCDPLGAPEGSSVTP